MLEMVVSVMHIIIASEVLTNITAGSLRIRSICMTFGMFQLGSDLLGGQVPRDASVLVCVVGGEGAGCSCEHGLYCTSFVNNYRFSIV